MNFMSLDYQITTEGDITFINFLTTVTFDKITRAVDDLAEHFSIEKRLWNLTVGYDMNSLEIQNIVEYISDKLPQKAKAAVVAPDDLSYGLSRMLEARRSRVCTHPHLFSVQWMKLYHGLIVRSSLIFYIAPSSSYQ
jgi:hypothetical protein